MPASLGGPSICQRFGIGPAPVLLFCNLTYRTLSAVMAVLTRGARGEGGVDAVMNVCLCLCNPMDEFTTRCFFIVRPQKGVIVTERPF